MAVSILRTMAYDNPEIRTRLQKKFRLNARKSETLFSDLKRFLFLSGLHSNKCVPPLKIDKAWHEFILYTKEYEAFCYKMFGTFIHHKPDSFLKPAKNKKKDAQATLTSARFYFGRLSRNWGRSRSAKCCSGTTRSCRSCASCKIG